MKVKIKKLNEDAIIPTYGSDGAACMDLYACLDNGVHLSHMSRALIPTGIAVEVPEGYVMDVVPRSGMSHKYGITILNSPGKVDSDYRGQVFVNLFCTDVFGHTVFHGDRIAQCSIVPVPKVEWEEVEELDDTERGDNGHGSTGR